MRPTKMTFGALALALACAGCTEQAANNSNLAANRTVASNVNATTTNANLASPSTSSSSNANEPATYRATYAISGQTSGAAQAAGAINMEVARNDASRRYSFNLPAPIGKVILLDRPDKRYLIIESQRRYMELTPEMTGFQMPRTWSPGQMVEQLQRAQGVERVGEEQMAGRTAVKYRIAGQAQTGTQAGQASGETMFWVDKETGFPVKIQGATSTTGQVQGVSGGMGSVELKDFQTTVDPTLFEIPQGYTAMTEQEVRQWQQMAQAALQLVFNMLGGGAQQQPAR